MEIWLLFDGFLSWVLVLLELVTDFIIFSLKNFYLVSLVFVVHLLPLDLIFKALHILLKLILFIIEFVFEGKEMFIEWNSISEERFIARSFVLLVDFSILEQFYFVFHEDDLFLHIEDVLFLQIFG